jgi:hypothetical protein
LLSFVAVRIDSSRLISSRGGCLALPLSYFTSRKTGDIHAAFWRAAGARIPGAERRQRADFGFAQIAAALALMFAYSPIARRGVFSR